MSKFGYYLSKVKSLAQTPTFATFQILRKDILMIKKIIALLAMPFIPILFLLYKNIHSLSQIIPMAFAAYIFYGIPYFLTILSKFINKEPLITTFYKLIFLNIVLTIFIIFSYFLTADFGFIYLPIIFIELVLFTIVDAFIKYYNKNRNAS